MFESFRVILDLEDRSIVFRSMRSERGFVARRGVTVRVSLLPLPFPPSPPSFKPCVTHDIYKGFSIRKTHIIETTCNILSYVVIQ